MKYNILSLVLLLGISSSAQTDTRYTAANVTNSTATGIVNHDCNLIFDNDASGHGAFTIINDTQKVLNGSQRGLYTEFLFDLENYYGYGEGIIFHDGRESIKAGIEYAESGYVTKLHSLTDKEYVDNKPLLSLASDPSGKPDGFVYYNFNTNKIRVKILGTFFSLIVE
jgi:hypothetical protein